MSPFSRVSVVLGAVATAALVALGAGSAAPQRGLAGSLDSSFAHAGVFLWADGKGDGPSANDVVVQPDRKIVVVGGETPGNAGTRPDALPLVRVDTSDGIVDDPA